MDKEELIKAVKEFIKFIPPLIWSLITAFVRVFYFVNKVSVRRTIGIVMVSVWSGLVTFQYVRDKVEGNMVGVYVSIAALSGEWIFSYLMENNKELIRRIIEVFFRNKEQK